MSERALDPDLKNEIASNGGWMPAFLVKFEFDSGELRFWTGPTLLDFAGDDYTGSGTLLSITEVEETQEIEAQGMGFQLSGVDSAMLSLALQENYQNRKATLSLGAIDEDVTLIGTPYEFFSGKMDVMEVSAGPQETTITLTVENDLNELKKKKIYRYTPEEQKRRYAGDYGLDFVPFTVEQEIIWGRASPK